MSRQPRSWWDPVEVAVGHTGYWQVGPLTLWAKRQKHEWQIAYRRDDTLPEDQGEWSCSVDEQQLSEETETERFVFQHAPARIQALAALADRPVVVRPATPFHVPGGQQASVYVSTPLWLSIQVGAEPQNRLIDLPVQRPSDTWFGASTREGELCYASRTRARLQLEELPRRSFRATSPVLIRNRSEEPMLLERLSLPAVNLALYATPDGFLWTQSITMTREKDGDMAALELGVGPPGESKRARLVAEARQRPEERVVLRALSALFG